MQKTIAFFPIDQEDLQQFIKTTIEETVRVNTLPSASSDLSELLTKKEAMKFLVVRQG